LTMDRTRRLWIVLALVLIGTFIVLSSDRA
jgi:hypothetical protein